MLIFETLFLLDIPNNEVREGFAALQQIRDKGYAKEYQTDGRNIHLIGANFSSEEGTVSEWKEG